MEGAARVDDRARGARPSRNTIRFPRTAAVQAFARCKEYAKEPFRKCGPRETPAASRGPPPSKRQNRWA